MAGRNDGLPSRGFLAVAVAARRGDGVVVLYEPIERGAANSARRTGARRAPHVPGASSKHPAHAVPQAAQRPSPGGG